MLPDRAWIAAHIPHQGDMCLLEEVQAWTPQSITCVTETHHKPDNPLRAGDALGIAHGIEYAAQAMAIHGALLAGADKTPAAGFLVSVRDVQWQRARLDDLNGPLQVHAERLSAAGANVMYGFRLESAGEPVMSGRASVVLDADAP